MSQQLLSPATLAGYVRTRGLGARVAGSDREELVVEDLSTGNMNRVYRVRGTAGSVIVKQAPPFVSSVGEAAPADPVRILTEAETYQLMAGTIPEAIPEIYAVDRDDYVLVMEDLVDFDVLRYRLVEQTAPTRRCEPTAPTGGPDVVQVGAAVGAALGRLTLATHRSAFAPADFRAFARAHANPELCTVTHNYVFEYPYRDVSVNTWIPELEADAERVHADAGLHRDVAAIRQIFDEKKESLLHGDLHTGSVMVRLGGDGDASGAVKLFDPEFSFVGPIGYDLGLFWVNLYIAAVAAASRGRHELARQRVTAAERSWGAFRKEWAAAAPGTLAEIEADAWQFAGMDAMRRVVGSAHIEDLTSLSGDAAVRANRTVLRLARTLISDGRSLSHDDVRRASGL